MITIIPPKTAIFTDIPLGTLFVYKDTLYVKINYGDRDNAVVPNGIDKRDIPVNIRVTVVKNITVEI